MTPRPELRWAAPVPGPLAGQEVGTPEANTGSRALGHKAVFCNSGGFGALESTLQCLSAGPPQGRLAMSWVTRFIAAGDMRFIC